MTLARELLVCWVGLVAFSVWSLERATADEETTGWWRLAGVAAGPVALVWYRLADGSLAAASRTYAAGVVGLAAGVTTWTVLGFGLLAAPMVHLATLVGAATATVVEESPGRESLGRFARLGAPGLSAMSGVAVVTLVALDTPTVAGPRYWLVVVGALLVGAAAVPAATRLTNRHSNDSYGDINE